MKALKSIPLVNAIVALNDISSVLTVLEKLPAVPAVASFPLEISKSIQEETKNFLDIC